MLSESSPLRYRGGGCSITCLVTGNRWKQNCYLVTHEATGNTVIVDPGGDAEAIIAEAEGAGKKVTRILLTHPHHDHVGAAQAVGEYFGVPCELHRDDLRLLMHAPMYALSFAKKKIAAVSRYSEFQALERNGEEPQLRALHTPGHTKGSVCYLFDGFAFTGDTLLRNKVGRTDLPGSSAAALRRSVAAILAALTDDAMPIFPGHGTPWSAGEARSWWQEQQDHRPEDGPLDNDSECA